MGTTRAERCDRVPRMSARGCYVGAARRGTTTIPSSPVPACAPITAPTSDTRSRATRGSRSRSRSASSSARSAGAEVVHGQVGRPVPGGPHRQLDQPLRRPRRGAHLLQRHDPALRHVQQRLHRQRGADQRRGGADPAAAAQPVERVDAEEHAAAGGDVRGGRLHGRRRAAPAAGGVGRRQHREAQAHRRWPASRPPGPGPARPPPRPAGPPPTSRTARATGAPRPPRRLRRRARPGSRRRTRRAPGVRSAPRGAGRPAPPRRPRRRCRRPPGPPASPSRTSSGTTRIPRSAASAGGQVRGRVGHDGDGHARDSRPYPVDRADGIAIRTVRAPRLRRPRRCSRRAASAGGRARRASTAHRQLPDPAERRPRRRRQLQQAADQPGDQPAVRDEQRRSPASRRVGELGVQLVDDRPRPRAPRRPATPRPAAPTSGSDRHVAIAPG